QPDLRGHHLDLAGVDLGVHALGVATAHLAADGDHVFGPQLLGRCHQRAVVRHHHLRDPVPIAHVEEEETAEIADTMNTAKTHGVGADARGTQGAAGVGTGEGAEGFRHCCQLHCQRRATSDELRATNYERRAARYELEVERRAASHVATPERGTSVCSPEVKSFTVPPPRARSSSPSIVTNRAPRVDAYFICLPSLSASGYPSTRRPPARSSPASASASG